MLDGQFQYDIKRCLTFVEPEMQIDFLATNVESFVSGLTVTMLVNPKPNKKNGGPFGAPVGRE